jgi:hypothetical protein
MPRAATIPYGCVEDCYPTPAGRYDVYRLYVYDAAALTDGATYVDVALPIQRGEQEFLLRRVTGADTVVNPGGTIWLKDALLREITRTPVFSPLMSNVAIIPERSYPLDSQVTFTLNNVLRVFHGPGGCGITACPASQLVFHGVGRRKKPPLGSSSVGDDFTFRSIRPHTIRFDVSLNWKRYINGPGPFFLPIGQNGPRTFYVPVENRDFLLCGLTFSVQPAFFDSGNAAMVIIRDRDGRDLMTAPTLLRHVACLADPLGVPSLYPGNSFFPPLLYPNGSLIELVVYSNLFMGEELMGYTYEFGFVGVEGRLV